MVHSAGSQHRTTVKRRGSKRHALDVQDPDGSRRDGEARRDRDDPCRGPDVGDHPVVRAQ